MSDRERRGWRDLTYNDWHRQESLRRFIGKPAAFSCGMVDIDSLEYCRWCYAILALVETARQRGDKNANATRALARKAGVPAYSLLYEVDDSNEERCGCGNITKRGDITKFWLRREEPLPTAKRSVALELTPTEWALCLHWFREEHNPHCPRTPTAPAVGQFIRTEWTRHPRDILSQFDAEPPPPSAPVLPSPERGSFACKSCGTSRVRKWGKELWCASCEPLTGQPDTDWLDDATEAAALTTGGMDGVGQAR